jgi:tetratricopeptide (TPR) repeat protein
MSTDATIGLEGARETDARERLEELQALARTYRNWSVKELAHALGRQPGRLVPESGLPKIDLVVGLAKALDWPVEAVVDHLLRPAPRGGANAGALAAGDFASLYDASLERRAGRDYPEAVRLAVRAHAVADTPTRCAAALSAEASAHEASGSYREAMRCLREATRLEGVDLEWRLHCDAKIANLSFMQGNATQAIGVASSVIEYAAATKQGLTARMARAFAHWARGQALRGAIPHANVAPWRAFAENALEDFHAASALADAVEAEPGVVASRNLDYAACIPAIVAELEAVVDPARAHEAVAMLLATIAAPDDPSGGPGERKAWAAIALASTAKRFVEDELQRRGALEIASATLRAHAVATSSWYFAHRHLEIESERRRALHARGSASRSLDSVEARLVAGVLGQVPAARASAEEYFALYGGREGAKPCAG